MAHHKASDDDRPISAAEAAELFAGLAPAPALVLAVSGGPDSMALMWLAARWRKSRAKGPGLIAVTGDHGLRSEASREAREVKQVARRLDLPHRTLHWRGDKPRSGLPEAARTERYRRRGGGGGGGAVGTVGEGGKARGPEPCPHRAHPRRPGRDAFDAAVARQRH